MPKPRGARSAILLAVISPCLSYAWTFRYIFSEWKVSRDRGETRKRIAKYLSFSLFPVRALPLRLFRSGSIRFSLFTHVQACLRVYWSEWVADTVRCQNNHSYVIPRLRCLSECIFSAWYRSWISRAGRDNDWLRLISLHSSTRYSRNSLRHGIDAGWAIFY